MNYLGAYRVQAYLKFLWQSSNQHGVHSPFVYQLVTRCFYNDQSYPAYEKLKAQRTDLLKALEMASLEKKDHKFQEIVPTTMMSLKRARLLNRLMRYLQVRRAIEIGTSFGLVSAAMATFNKADISNVQQYASAADITRQNFSSWGLNKVKVSSTDLSQMLESLGHTEKQLFDLVYINSQPEPQTSLKYFEQLLPYAHNESVFIIEDIHSSPKAQVSWETLRNHPEVRVSIDTFKWGLIFLRKEQVKEHFVIRV